MYILIGSHGTGKTTLLENFQKTNPEFYTSDGFSRPVKKVSNRIELSSYQEQQVINELTSWRWSQDLFKKNCIYTRSLIDTIIYSEALFPEIDTSLYREIFKQTYKHVHQIFYIPIEFELEQDDILRPIDKPFQLLINREIARFLQEYDITPVIISGSVEERVQQLIQNL